MNIIIVGCGRVGVELALSLCRRHLVTVIDVNALAFDRLGSDFNGRTVQGEGFDRDVLRRAGIEKVGALASVTTSDNVNVVVARMAREIYHIPHVVARVYNPRRINIYEKFGLQTVASSSWGAQRIEQLLIHPGLLSVFSAGNGEVQLYEISVSDDRGGRTLEELIGGSGAIPMALVRNGRAALAQAGEMLCAQDILHVSETTEGASVLRQRLHVNGNGKG